MRWNYRVIKHEQGECVFYELHKVYYDDNGLPDRFTDKAVSIVGNNLNDIEWSLKKIKKAIKKPIISAKNFPNEIEICKDYRFFFHKILEFFNRRND